MSRRRIFISHSTKDATTPAEQEAADVQTALVQALKDAGDYSILMDRLTLQAGDAWRARINLWVGGCDAAVVLISRAALTSAYVAYETSILSYRSQRDPGFVLIPVLVPPVDLGALNASTLGSVQQLDEKHYVTGTVEQIVRTVLDRLRDLASCESPVEQRARALTNLMREVPEEHLANAAELLGLEHLDEWLPRGDQKLRLRLAVQLMSVGMHAAGTALLVLRNHLASDVATRRQRTEDLITLVASSWVDYRAATHIPRVIDEKKRYALSLTAQSDTTVRMYATCALSDRPSWYLATCNAVFGERPVATLKREVRDALVAELNTTPEDLSLDLAALDDQPILVTLDGRGITSRVLAELRSEFPGVVFFLLSSGNGVSLTPEEVEILIPPLQRDDEEAFIRAYDTFHRRIRVRA